MKSVGSTPEDVQIGPRMCTFGEQNLGNSCHFGCQFEIRAQVPIQISKNLKKKMQRNGVSVSSFSQLLL
jgi:hypothetical protein